MKLRLLTACALTALVLCTGAKAAPPAAYVTNYTSTGGITAFPIGAGGELQADDFAASSGANTWYEAATPNGRYLYVTNNAAAPNGTVAQFAIAADGALSPLSPATVAAGSYPTGIAVSPDGKHVYVAEYNTGALAIFDVGSDGTLTPNATQPTVTANLDRPYGAALTPDGKSLYVPNRGLGSPGGTTLAEFDVASDGTLTPKATPTVAASNGPTNGPDYVVITPNGRFAYATDYLNDDVFQYTVGADGELTPNGTPIGAGAPATHLSATVSPDGQSLYLPNGSAIYQFSIGSTGLLSAKFPSTVTSGSNNRSVWFTADGKSAYAANDASSTDGTVSEWDVAGNGELSAKSTPAVMSVAGASAVMIAPDQGPIASFSDTPGQAGAPSHFNGSTSQDSDGSVASYAWSFGDGATAPNGGPKPAHTYARPGHYTVTLTVTDEEGCSTAFVFTGGTAYCNGTAAARQTRKVAIAASPPKLITGAAKHLTRHSATLTGSVNPHGVATTYRFQYGRTARYGNHTPPESAGAVTFMKAVSAKVLGLRPGTTYHYRVVATNPAGTTNGADRTFRTPRAG